MSIKLRMKKIKEQKIESKKGCKHAAFDKIAI